MEPLNKHPRISGGYTSNPPILERLDPRLYGNGRFVQGFILQKREENTNQGNYMALGSANQAMNGYT